MNPKHTISRRKFMGGLALAAGYFSLGSVPDLQAQRVAAESISLDAYDALAKLSFNENPYGPPESVLKAMTMAMKYANRYGNPDGGILQAIADHHGVGTENILLGAGSTEILDVVDSTFLGGTKKVIGVEPTYTAVYEYALGLKSASIRIPLLPDHRQDIPAMIKAANDNAADVGFLYLCNPNNPTGAIVTKDEIKHLLDSIPSDMPVLIDEAYHHFVESPAYETSIPYVKAGRPVIVARTFSKIVGLAGMRLGYAVAPAPMIQRMRPHAVGSINALVKWGGAAALKDLDAQAKVKAITLELRKKTTSELTALGFSVIPSEANFFMVDIGRPVTSVGGEFRKRGVLVGRPFPPMNNHLRVTVGNADEMARFMTAFKEIIPAGSTATVTKPG